MSLFFRIVWKAKGMMLRHGPMMMTCAEFEAFIIDYLSDNLPPAQKRIFEWHLKVCRECRDYLEAYRRTVQLGKAVFRSPTGPLPEGVPEDLVKAIIEARSAV